MFLWSVSMRVVESGQDVWCEKVKKRGREGGGERLEPRICNICMYCIVF